jgi:signal transduction histidine kinase
MEASRPPLRDEFFAELEQGLGEWLAAAEAQTAKLAVLAEAHSCPCGVDVGLTDDSLSARLLEGACPGGEEGQVLAAAGEGQSPRLLCLRCPVAEGDTLTLQVGFAAVEEALPEGAGLARLAAPLLMWARTLLERRISEDYLQAELRHALTAQDEEREWIALEVHDRIAQTLASVFQQLQTLEGLARSYPEIRQVAVRGSLLCREAIREARNIMNDLQPPVLDDLGLVPALEEELREVAERTPCRVTQSLSLTGRPPRGIELSLYRIFRESLVNIQRHAQAKEVRVALREEGEGIRLEVSDNGSGFDVRNAMKRKRIGGLLSMRRRAEVVGGICQVQSEPGQGTRVTVWLPLSPLPPDMGASRRREWQP